MPRARGGHHVPSREISIIIVVGRKWNYALLTSPAHGAAEFNKCSHFTGNEPPGKCFTLHLLSFTGFNRDDALFSFPSFFLLGRHAGILVGTLHTHVQADGERRRGSKIATRYHK